MNRRRFSEAQKTEILADYAAGVKVAAIAAKHGCAESYPGTLAGRRGAARRLSAVDRERMADAARARAP